MELVGYLKNKFGGQQNKKRLLSLINSNLIMVIVSMFYAKQPTGSREFLLNGVSDKILTQLKSVDDLKQTDIIMTFFKGFLILSLIWIILFIILHVIQHFIKSITYQYGLILINITLFGLVNMYKVQEDIISTMIISTIVLGVFYFLLMKKKVFSLESLEISNRKSRIFLLMAFLSYVIIIGGLTVLKYMSYQQNIFDTSIFSQMFYYMSKWGLPFTTVERQRLLSHFAVHFSPVYYLLLPFFMIFKSPIYLAIAKTLLMASGVFPLYKICKQKGLSNLLALMLSLSYLLFPFLIASNIGDGNGHILNENYFYPAFLIWIFYYMENKNFKAMWIFCILTLFIKEDAPIVLACIGLYLIFSKKSNLHGKIIFVVSGLYFIICTKLIIPQFGNEYLILSYYNNFVPDSSLAFPSILYAFIYKPSYVIQQIFTPGKITFLLQLLVPLLLLPLVMLKKIQNLVLVIPIVLTSLLCINPTYIYGIASHQNMVPICISFYLTILALSEIKSKQHQLFLTLSILLVTAIFSTSYNINKVNYLDYYIENRQNIKLIDNALSKIPEAASVTAVDRFSTKLTNRYELYNFFNPSCDYVVIDLRNFGDNDAEITKTLLKGTDYGVMDFKKDLYLILLKKHSVEMNNSVNEELFAK